MVWLNSLVSDEFCTTAGHENILHVTAPCTLAIVMKIRTPARSLYAWRGSRNVLIENLRFVDLALKGFLDPSPN